MTARYKCNGIDILLEPSVSSWVPVGSEFLPFLFHISVAVFEGWQVTLFTAPLWPHANAKTSRSAVWQTSLNCDCLLWASAHVIMNWVHTSETWTAFEPTWLSHAMLTRHTHAINNNVWWVVRHIGKTIESDEMLTDYGIRSDTAIFPTHRTTCQTFLRAFVWRLRLARFMVSLLRQMSCMVCLPISQNVLLS